MKKNWTMRAAVLLLVLTLMTSCFVGGTFAKYTSTVTGSDTATVAKWSFKQNAAELVGQNAVTFNLFDTITNDDANGNSVAANKIAPGTSGSFALAITNDSEVKATYAITYTVTNNSVPIEFSVDGGANWSNSLANVSATTLEIGDDINITVQWRWKFNGGVDATDTAAGKAASDVTVQAVVTFEQVD